jgi:hypothetical protein
MRAFMTKRIPIILRHPDPRPERLCRARGLVRATELGRRGG